MRRIKETIVVLKEVILTVYLAADIALIMVLFPAKTMHELQSLILRSILRKRSTAQGANYRLLFSIKYLIPRKHRENILGDLLEDIDEMRRDGFSTWKIRAVVYYQLAWAIVKLWPATVRAGVFAWLGAKMQQWLS